MKRLRAGVDVLRFAVPLLALLYFAVFGVLAAEAVVNPNPPPGLQVSPRISPELVVGDWTVGGPVQGFLAQSTNTTFDPANDPYPISNPTSAL